MLFSFDCFFFCYRQNLSKYHQRPVGPIQSYNIMYIVIFNFFLVQYFEYWHFIIPFFVIFHTYLLWQFRDVDHDLIGNGCLSRSQSLTKWTIFDFYVKRSYGASIMLNHVVWVWLSFWQEFAHALEKRYDYYYSNLGSEAQSN